MYSFFKLGNEIILHFLGFFEYYHDDIEVMINGGGEELLLLLHDLKGAAAYLDLPGKFYS